MNIINFVKVKWCWVATQTSLGWKMKMVVGDKLTPDRTISLRGVSFESEKDIKRAFTGNIVFVYMKNGKESKIKNKK
jgi:hypothetical protein